MSLISLVYVSFASHPMTDEELQAILAEARDFNKPNNITGMLLYRDGFFIQALEGEAEVVEPLYNGISKDERHKNVLLVYKNTITERSFSDWSMGFNKIEAGDGGDLPGFTDFLAKPSAEYFTDHPSRATVLLESFKNKTYF